VRFPIIIGLRRSFLLGALVLFAHVAALLAISVPAWPWAGLLAIMVLISLAFSSWRWWRLPADGLRLEADGRITLTAPGREAHVECELLPGSLAHPWLTVLRLRCPDRLVTVAIAADSAAAADRRHLRVWLRWVAKVGDPASGAP